jgi:hypothetical protein
LHADVGKLRDGYQERFRNARANLPQFLSS